MPRLSQEFKQAIQEIPVEELQKLLIQLTSKNKKIYDFVNIHYVDNEDAEDELFEETIAKIRDEISLMA
jgi:hypothetical protein